MHLSQMQPETAATLPGCQQTESLWTLRKRLSPFSSRLPVQIWPEDLTSRYKTAHLRGVPNAASSPLGTRSSAAGGVKRTARTRRLCRERAGRASKGQAGGCCLLPGWGRGTRMRQHRQSQRVPSGGVGRDLFTLTELR